MPSKSQSQARLFNWVHAVQSGEAKGSGKVNEIAKEMKPSDTEHYMNRGHIDKSLPEKVSAFTDYIRAIKHTEPDKRKEDEVPGGSEARKYYRQNASSHDSYKERVKEHQSVSREQTIGKLMYPDLYKNSCDTCGCGKPHEHHTHEEYLKHIAEKKANFVSNSTGTIKNDTVAPTSPIQEPDRTFHKVRKAMTTKKAEDFAIGFMKAAAEHGIEPLVALQMLKHATLGGTALGAGVGGLTGAGLMGLGLGARGLMYGLPVGGIVGGVNEMSKPEKDRHYISGIGKGALGGAAIGGLGGAALGAGIGGIGGAALGGFAGSEISNAKQEAQNLQLPSPYNQY